MLLIQGFEATGLGLTATSPEGTHHQKDRVSTEIVEIDIVCELIRFLKVFCDVTHAMSCALWLWITAGDGILPKVRMVIDV